MIYFSQTLPMLEDFTAFTVCEDFLTPSECRKIMKLMPDEKMLDARISTEEKLDTSIRSTKILALDYNTNTQWIFQKLSEAIVQGNHHAYRYEILGFDQPVQLMKYEVNDHYDWHMDAGARQFSQRKLSISVQLSEEQDYSGGAIEFFRNGEAPKMQGTLIMFPSFLYHRVLPVTRGTRRALVGWVTGVPLR